MWALHPAITLFVIVATENHYWLDAATAAALLLVILAVTRLLPSRRRPRTAMPPIPAPRPVTEQADQASRSPVSL